MSLSRKRKEGNEKSPLIKRRKTLPDVANTNESLSSDLNCVIKVENEFDNLFEEESDLTIKNALQGIKLDIFHEDLNSSVSESYQTEHIGNCSHKIVAPSISIEKIAKNSPRVRKIIDVQKEALKLIQTALMKFESVTKDLQELVEFEIEEAEAEAEAEADKEITSNSGFDPLQITSIEGQSCVFEESVSANLPIKDKVVGENEESSLAVTKSKSAFIQSKDSSKAVHGSENGQKNKKLIKKCTSTKNISSKLPCDEAIPSMSIKSRNEHDKIVSDSDDDGDNDASNTVPENLCEVVISSLKKNRLATLSSQVEDFGPSTSHGIEKPTENVSEGRLRGEGAVNKEPNTTQEIPKDVSGSKTSTMFLKPSSQPNKTSQKSPSEPNTSGNKEEFLHSINSLGSGLREEVLRLREEVKAEQQTMWNALTELVSVVKQTDSKTKSLLDRVTEQPQLNLPDQCMQSEEATLLARLPVNRDDFILLNEKLAVDSTFRQELTRVFMSIGGRDVKALAANCLRKVIVDEVGENFSLTGKQSKAGQAKQPFQKTEVYKLVLETCLRTFGNSKENVVREAVSDWLMQAKFRKSRREKRMSSNQESY